MIEAVIKRKARLNYIVLPIIWYNIFMLDLDILKNCTLCPRRCGADRTSGEKGFCGADFNIKAARCALHFWEEPPVSGERGSGTVFFSNCPLKCAYCQNKKISSGGYGAEITTERLAEIFLELQESGAHNINLVSPTQYTPHIIVAVNSAKQSGLAIPVVYNTGGYELPEIISQLKGTVDIFLTDFKYIDEHAAQKYSNCPDYPYYAEKSLEVMVKNAGKPVFDKDGIMKSGVIVRHLLLPGQLKQAEKIVEYLYKSYGGDIYLSLMNQYTPAVGVPEEISKRVDEREYEELIDFALDLGVEQCFVQEDGTAQECYIPDFDLSGVIKTVK